MRDHPDGRTLSAYVDGRLAEDERAEIEGHLADCGECSSFVDRSRGLMAELRSLPREIRPPPELRRPWLEASTGAGRSGRAGASRPASPLPRSRTEWLAAAAVLLVAVASALVVSGPWSEPPGTPVSPAVTGPPGRPDPGLQAQIREYESASRELAERYRRHRGSVAGELAETVDASLARLDEAILRTSRAVERHPDEDLVRRMLLSRYEQKVALLRRTLDLWREG